MTARSHDRAAGPPASRRAVTAGLGLGLLLGLPCAALAAGVPAAVAAPEDLRALGEIEARTGGRLGLTVMGADGRVLLTHRAFERFAMCSTFKLLLAAAVLRRIDDGLERIDRPIAYGAGDLLAYAPVTRARLGEGAMSVGDLCAAAVTLSDNAAANLLLNDIGGPPGLTAFARRIGDGVTRLDRNEPALNSAVPGDLRDTTSPAAMAADVARLLFGAQLSAASQGRLAGWLVDCRTGRTRLRAGLPAGLKAGDKTGTGDNGTVNDVAVLWPGHGPPLIIAAYVTGATAGAAALDTVHADLARLAVKAAGL